MKVSYINEVIGGKLLNSVRHSVKGISIDSRTVKRTDLFIALKGENFDGHDFIGSVIKKGVKCIIVSERFIKRNASIIRKNHQACFIVVKDTLKALGDIAHDHRKRFNMTVIGITGSTGKTTVKEIIAHVLRTKYSVLKNEGTKNNLIGLPLSILKLKKRHQFCVLEMGTNMPGEIKRLAQIAGPDLGVITNIGHSHLEYLGDKKNVYREKRELLRTLGRNSIAVLNIDDEYLSSQKHNCRVKYFGINKKCKYRAKDIKAREKGLSFSVEKERFYIPFIGAHNVYNALAGIACGDIFNIEMRRIKKALRYFRNPLRDRLSISRHNRISIINDTYNSNPLSFETAVKTLTGIRGKGRTIVVSSDMLELGERAPYFHAEAGKLVARSGVDYLITCGDQSRHTSRAAVRTGMHIDKVYHMSRNTRIGAVLKKILRPDDILLIKGSRGTHMENVFNDLIANIL